MHSESTRVLIVEHAADDEGEISTMLETAGYTIRTATTSQLAIDLLNQWQPHALVVDLRVPNQEGRRLCASLAEHSGGANPPVVLLGELSNMMKRTPIVPFGLVATPFDGTLLEAAVRRATAQQENSAAN